VGGHPTPLGGQGFAGIGFESPSAAAALGAIREFGGMNLNLDLGVDGALGLAAAGSGGEEERRRRLRSVIDILKVGQLAVLVEHHANSLCIAQQRTGQ
jgi:hypothetical protein